MVYAHILNGIATMLYQKLSDAYIRFPGPSGGEKTYGSHKIKRYSPAKWGSHVKDQPRNSKCNYNSGKKYKYCCGKAN